MEAYDRIPTRCDDPLLYDLGHHAGRHERISRETALLLLTAALSCLAGVLIGALAQHWIVLPLVVAIAALLLCASRRPAEQESEVRDADV